MPSNMSTARPGARTPPGSDSGWAARRSRRPTRPPGWRRGSPAWRANVPCGTRPPPVEPRWSRSQAAFGDSGGPTRSMSLGVAEHVALRRGMATMAGSVIVAGARTPIGKLSGALGGFTAIDLGGFAIKAALERAGVAPDEVDYVFMGQVLQAGAGPDHRPPGRGQRRHPHDRAGHHRQQGVPVGPQHHLSSPTSSSQAGDGRHRGGRRHGVDDQRPVPAARGPGRLPPRRPGRRRLDDVRRPVLRLRPVSPWARAPRSTRRRPASPAVRQDEFAATSHERAAAAMKDGLLRRRDRRRSRCRSARATRSWSTPTRACARARRAETLGGLRPAFDRRRQHHRGQRHPDLRRRRPPSSSCRRRRPSELGVAARRGRSATARSPAPDHVAADPAVAGHPRGARPGRQVGRRRRPVRAQRGVRRRRPRLDGTSSASPTTSSTSTAAPSRSVTRSACPAPAWRCTLAARAAAPRRRPRRRRAVRRRRPGRRHPALGLSLHGGTRRLAASPSSSRPGDRSRQAMALGGHSAWTKRPT